MFDRWSDPDHCNWSKMVRTQDRWNCQLCTRVKGDDISIVAHHLNGYNLFVDQRYHINNGITLCSKCHDLFHLTFGKGNNTKVQFEQFRKFYKLIEDLAIKGFK